MCRLVEQADDFELIASLTSSSDLNEILAADVVVDVSLPTISQEVVELAVANGKHVLVGTSGWSAERIDAVRPIIEAHPQVNVIFIQNFSLGSAVGTHLATIAARYFESIEIVEAHGSSKVDSPSGTAVNTAERIAAVRQGDIKAPHSDQTARGELIDGVPVHSLRMDGVVAKQDVIFGGDGETVTITHTTFSNRSYEAGIMASLRAVLTRPGITVGLDKVIDLT